jgi:lipoprotein-anchoring transpeptidase ErfK/SrfK
VSWSVIVTAFHARVRRERARQRSLARPYSTHIAAVYAIPRPGDGTSQPGLPLARAGRCLASAVAGLGLLLIAACQGGNVAAQTAAVYPMARVTITTGNLRFTSAVGSGRRVIEADRAASGHTGVARLGAAVPVDQRPDLGVSVTARRGVLARVSVTSATGQSVAGSFTSGAVTWHTTWALAPAQTYRVAATAVNSHGTRTVTAGTFRTLAPAHTFTASAGMTAGQTVGVGMAIMVTFSQPIVNKAAVERSFDIYASKPVTGAWYWMSNETVWFRPQKYWPAHTKVRFTAHLSGVQGAPGVYGRADLSQHFTIGDSLVAVASTATHVMKVWWNGRSEGAWPISTGQPGDDTPDGQYLSFAMANPVDMDSASYGVMPGQPGYYNIWVYDAVQFTFSGDYVHSAPWSVGEQGIVNVSHGCVNVAPGNAAWYYEHSMLGDPITVTGSPVAGTWGNGWTIWFLSWSKLLAGSATGDAVVADSLGSQLVPAAVTPATQPPGQRLRSLLPLPARCPS